jgi:DNA-binding transcriptional LysR family regulator
MAAGSGAGTACLPLFVARAFDKLIETSNEQGLNLTREAWLLMRPDQRDVASVRAVADWIVEVFRDSEPKLTG